MTKLLNKKTKEEVDIAPDAVAAAIDSGQFGFSSKRGVPVNYDGKLGYVKPEYASKHRDRLLFVNEDDVERGQAEERFKGPGGALQALGYGAAKGLTLGTLPALGAAISPEFAEYSRQIELGRPGLTTAGEIGSLVVDPFAVAGKALGLGAKAGREVVAGAEAARAAEAAAPRALLAERVSEAAPELRLGAGAAPQAEAALGREGAVPARALPPSRGRDFIEAEFTQEAAPLATRAPVAEPPPAAPQLPPAGRPLAPAGPEVLQAEFAPELGLTVPRYAEGEAGRAAAPSLGAGRAAAPTAEELRLGGAGIPVPQAARAAEEAAMAPASAEAVSGAAAGAKRGFGAPGDIASMAAQGGIYGASEEARRQATGESEGGLGAVLGAGAVGAALPAAMMLGGKALAKGAGKAAELGAGALPTSERFAKAAGGVEDAHILRMFGISPKQVERLNAQFSEAGAGKKGTANFSDFIKREVANVADLKTHLPDNEILQSIPTDLPLKFGQLTPERRTAIAEAVKAKLGKQYDELLTPEVLSARVGTDALRSILRSIEGTAVKGVGGSQFRTISPELNALRRVVNSGEDMSVGELRQMRKTLDDIFSARNGGYDKPFTAPQTAFRNAIDNVTFAQIDAVAPGTSDALRALNREYTMAGILDRGARAAETKAATTSPIGRDLLSQAALGVAIGNPIGAAMFFVGSTFMRGIYNSRGDGIIADLAGKAERAALRVQQNPVQAAQQASKAIIDARRPMLLAGSAQQLTEAKPTDYTSLSRAVRELQQSREQTKAEVQRSVSHLPPEEQQKAIQNFDTVVNALASEMPKGLAMDKALSEQERRYMVFARSVLDPAYGTQVLVNGGPDADEAAKAFASLGPSGNEYLKTLADDLRAKINESEALRGDPQLQQVYRNIKSKVSVSMGGGRARLAGLHAPAAAGAGLKPAPMVSPQTAKAMAASLTGMGPSIR